MSIYTTDTCFGCQTTIERESGTYYCNACIAAQYAELSAERQAFEDFHAYADKVARTEFRRTVGVDSVLPLDSDDSWMDNHPGM